MEFLEAVKGSPQPGGSYSLAVSDGQTVYLAGHFGKTEEGVLPERFEDEVGIAIDNLSRTLSEFGLSLADVAQVTCVLTDVANFERFDQVYRSKFCAPYPARLTFGVALAGGLRFEILGTARRSPEGGESV